MIEITAKETSTRCSIEVKGHAGYNPGNDIVCAAVSALIQTYAESARNNIGDSWLVSCHIESGDALVESAGKTAIYRSCVCGLLMLRNAYPDNIKIRIESTK